MFRDETLAQLAERVATSTSAHLRSLLKQSGDPEGAVFELIVHQAVMRAFGCSCRTDRAVGPVYFEDIVCSVHGIGPIELPKQPRPRSDPGH